VIPYWLQLPKIFPSKEPCVALGSRQRPWTSTITI